MAPFPIKSLQHPLVKHCVNLRQSAAYRHEMQSFLIPCRQQIQELPEKLSLLKLFSLEGHPPIRKAEHCLTVSQEVLKKITGLVSPEPYAAILALPQLKPTRYERLLICDRISDPGNLGTLLRTALSFGFDAAFLLPGCVDPFNDKVVRSAKGALFHLPLLFGDWDDLLLLQKQKGLHLYQADLQGSALEETSFSLPLGLILGNESQGTSWEAKKCAQDVAISINPSMDSLNVAIAGGIFMFTMRASCQKMTTTST
ncbi:MAG: RNA methyltransferase [Chlamydiae bacterium]|nr:RNA methyltransferase [Chlamydiota bacterium]